MGREDENLISIDEVIRRVQDLGVSFGNGDPRNRLRYYVKIGLLPHAQRKSFNNNSPEGAYSEDVVGLLFEIAKKIRTGKSIQAIKREIKEEKEKKEERLFETPFAPSLPIHIYKPSPPPSEIKEEFQFEEKPKPSFKLSAFLKLVFIVLALGLTVFFINAKINFGDLVPYFLATIERLGKLTQLESPSPLQEEILLTPSFEPYLTINAETDINAPLNVKEIISAPAFTMIKDDFKATLISADLTADRAYTFPNLSGVVCLTTGNCVGIGGEVFSPGGIPNRLAKFITSREVGVSSIEDFYTDGVAITIDSVGKVGIGTSAPEAKLEVAGDVFVEGEIQATGDICTDLRGGKCLSQLTAFPTFFWGGGGGISGSGAANYLPVWTGSRELGNSVIYQSGSNIGIGTTSPGQKLTVAGNGLFSGYLTIATTALPQLILKYDDDNYLNFAIDGTQSLITASKKMVIDSLTGEIKLGDNVTLFNATSSEIRGATFVSAADDSTVRKSGEKVFRGTIPIFRFPVPAQTNSTSFVAVSREISTTTLNAALPESLPGTDRKIAFLINFADDIPTSASSTWLVDLETGTDTEFTFTGQNLSSLEEGKPYLSDFYPLPDNDWQLEVKVPASDRTIRIFNILLLAYDQIQ